MNLLAGEVLVRGERLKLRPLELRLLTYLVRNAGRLLSYDRILEAVWGHEYTGDRASLKLYIWRLRQKIEKDPARPQGDRDGQAKGCRNCWPGTGEG